MAILDHVYDGPAIRIDSNYRHETISGAFRIIREGNDSTLYTVVGNGEMPEGRWLISPLRFNKLEKVD